MTFSQLFLAILGCYLLFWLDPALSAQETIRDYDGNVYMTVRIGEQLWMAENLRSVHDANGKLIDRICYGRKEENCKKFGGMYSWDALGIVAGNMQGICPHGWHIPADDEWSLMIETIGGADDAAYRLRTDTTLGFNVQFGGNYHNRLENFNYLDKIAYYWTADNYSPTAAWMRMIGKKNRNTNRSTVPRVYCLSVRCVKD